MLRLSSLVRWIPLVISAATTNRMSLEIADDGCCLAICFNMDMRLPDIIHRCPLSEESLWIPFDMARSFLGTARETMKAAAATALSACQIGRPHVASAFRRCIYLALDLDLFWLRRPSRVGG